MGNIKDFFEYILNAVKFWIIVQPWEQGIRVRFGKKIKLLNRGMYFRIPYIDSVYVQSVRLRAIDLSIQTLTSKDKQTITLNGSMGYSITDIEKLYKTLYSPCNTLSNIAMSSLANFICNNDVADIQASGIEEAVRDKIDNCDYGIKIEYFGITNFAIVKTIRLIQDHSWVADGQSLDIKK